MRIVGTVRIVPEVVILPKGTTLAADRCEINGQRFEVVKTFLLADRHVEWTLDRAHGAAAGDVVRRDPMPPQRLYPRGWEECVLSVCADYDLPAAALFGVSEG